MLKPPTLGRVERCPWCEWPLKERQEDGCVVGNCSQRPRPKHRDERAKWPPTISLAELGATPADLARAVRLALVERAEAEARALAAEAELAKPLVCRTMFCSETRRADEAEARATRAEENARVVGSHCEHQLEAAEARAVAAEAMLRELEWSGHHAEWGKVCPHCAGWSKHRPDCAFAMLLGAR